MAYILIVINSKPSLYGRNAVMQAYFWTMIPCEEIFITKDRPLTKQNRGFMVALKILMAESPANDRK